MVGLSSFRSWLYDVIIVKMTTLWYRTVLIDLSRGSRVLDVGIGTATALLNNAALVIEKKICVEGIDIDEAYIRTAKAAITSSPLNGLVKADLGDALTFQADKKYDAIYFSGSFMIIPNKAKMLRRLVDDCLVPGGSVYFTQTFEREWFLGYLMRYIKPILKLITTIDFGEVTFWNEFETTLSDAGVQIKRVDVMYTAKFQARRHCMVIAVSK